MAHDLIRQEIGTKRAGEDMTAARGKAVVFNSLDRWQIAGLTGPLAGQVHGILTNNPASGGVASVQVFGVAMAKLGGTVTGGRFLDIDANGDLIESEPNGQVGFAMDSGVAGSIIPVFLVNRISSTSLTLKGFAVTEVFQESDFPVAVGGVITLPSGIYIIKKAFSTANRFELEPNAIIEWTSEDKENHTVTYTGTGIMFRFDLGITGRSKLTHASLILSGDGAQLVDQNGGNCKWNDLRVTFTGIGGSIGIFRDSSSIQGAAEWLDSTIAGFQDGLVYDNIGGLQVLNNLFLSDGTGTGALLSVLSKVIFATNLNQNAFSGGVSQSNYFLDPVLDLPISILFTNTLGPQSFFKSGVTGTITGVTDLTNTNAVTAAAAGTSGTDFTAVAHGYKVGDIIVHSTFSESTYNGTFTITDVTADTYEIAAITFVATDTGTGTVNEIRIASTAHGLSDGQSLSVFGTINYDDGYIIHGAVANSFDVYAIFVVTETGTWDTGSLTETSKFVTAENNGDQADSKTIGSIVVGGNATATVISTINTFVDLNLGSPGAAEEGNIELFTLTNAVTGEIRYDGLEPASLLVNGLAAAFSAGGGQRFNFRLLQNGAPLPSPDNVDIPIEIGAELSSAPLHWPIKVVNGDLFRLQVENADGTSNITIDTLKFAMN